MKTEDLSKAYWFWAKYIGLTASDDMVRGLNQIPEVAKGIGWLETCREGLWLTQAELGQRLNVSRATYRSLEESEKRGAASLCKLQRAAEAMDCEFIYFIRPKQRKVFSAILWDQIYQDALKVYERRTKGDIIRPIILARMAVFLSKKKKVRVHNKWRRLLGREINA